MFAAQVGQKVDSVCVVSRSAELSHNIRVETVLTTYLKASRRKSMRFRSGKPLRVFLNDQGLD